MHTGHDFEAIDLTALHRTKNAVTKSVVLAVELCKQLLHFLALRVSVGRAGGFDNGHIAHSEGFSVMAHANGARTVEAAAVAGVDSIEHGAYLDDDALAAMAGNGTIWCPTLSAIGNLRGRGRFDEAAVNAIYGSSVENLRKFTKIDGLVAPGSDAGAWAVPHVTGGMDEYAHLTHALGEGAEVVIRTGISAIRTKF